MSSKGVIKVRHLPGHLLLGDREAGDSTVRVVELAGVYVVLGHLCLLAHQIPN